MNWKLIFGLSLFGLVMAVATVYWIPTRVEALCWFLIFIFGATVIAKKCTGNFFLHGFLVSMVNSVWITLAHVLLFKSYMETHPEMQSMSANMPLANHPRLMMLLSGPVFGSIFGIVFGLFAMVGGMIVKKQKQVN